VSRHESEIEKWAKRKNQEDKTTKELLGCSFNLFGILIAIVALSACATFLLFNNSSSRNSATNPEEYRKGVVNAITSAVVKVDDIKQAFSHLNDAIRNKEVSNANLSQYFTAEAMSDIKSAIDQSKEFTVEQEIIMSEVTAGGVCCTNNPIQLALPSNAEFLYVVLSGQFRQKISKPSDRAIRSTDARDMSYRVYLKREQGQWKIVYADMLLQEGGVGLLGCCDENDNPFSFTHIPPKSGT
jgi:hypothetical protein